MKQPKLLATLPTDIDEFVRPSYRDVALNIRIVNQDTIKLGAHLHICEMQLILVRVSGVGFRVQGLGFTCARCS
jgi:hypothetical protein